MWLREYVPALLAVAFAAGLGLLASLLAGRWGPARLGLQTPAAPPQPHAPLALRLYPLVLAFLVFDMAVVSLYPWAVYFGQASVRCSPSECPGNLRHLAAGATFVAVAAVAWLVVRRTRAAEWNASP